MTKEEIKKQAEEAESYRWYDWVSRRADPGQHGHYWTWKRVKKNYNNSKNKHASPPQPTATSRLFKYLHPHYAKLKAPMGHHTD